VLGSHSTRVCISCKSSTGTGHAHNALSPPPDLAWQGLTLANACMDRYLPVGHPLRARTLAIYPDQSATTLPRCVELQPCNLIGHARFKEVEFELWR